jgi:hypothetical protein
MSRTSIGTCTKHSQPSTLILSNGKTTQELKHKGFVRHFERFTPNRPSLTALMKSGQSFWTAFDAAE